jgi:hypothetical protein
MDALDRTLRERLQAAGAEISSRPLRTARLSGDAALRHRTLRPLFAALALAGVVAATGAGLGLHARLAARHSVPASTPPPSLGPSPATTPATPMPSPTWEAAPFIGSVTATWDSTHHVVVAYQQADVKAQDTGGHTWTWDGGWHEQHPAHNTGLFDQGPLVDMPPLHGVVLLGPDPENFGKETDFGSWAWDGADWTRLPAAGYGNCLIPGAAAWDPVHRYAVLVVRNQCSGDSTIPSPETWTFDGHTWRHRGSYPVGRSPMDIGLLAWDPDLRAVVAVNGNAQGRAQAWRWSGSGWITDGRAASLTFPAGANGAGWDARSSSLVVYAAPEYAGTSPARMLAFRHGTWSELAPHAYPEYVDAVFPDAQGHLLAIGMPPIPASGSPGGFSAGEYYVLDWTGADWWHVTYGEVTAAP